MAENENRENFDQNTPSEDQLFAGTPYGPDAKEVFSGDEDFYKNLARNSSKAPVKPHSPPTPTPHNDYPLPDEYASATRPKRRFCALQIMLLALIVAIAGVLLYAVLGADDSSDRFGPHRAEAVDHEPRPLQVQPDTEKVDEQLKQELREQPLSLNLAQRLYAEGDYRNARIVYQRLKDSLPEGEQRLMRDFLTLQTALCQHKEADTDAAVELYQQTLKSPSPLLKALANYYITFIEIDRQRFFNARKRAYQSLALINAADPSGQNFADLRRQCEFITAETLTRYVLDMRDCDHKLPDGLWTTTADMRDFLTESNESDIRALLDAGTDDFRNALLSPKIQTLYETESPRRYTAVSTHAPIEELMARIASNADMDIIWDASVDPSARKRPVSLYSRRGTAADLANIAAGSTGLMAHIKVDDPNNVTVYDLEVYSSLSDHLELLTSAAGNLWQVHIMRHSDTQDVPKAHFATAVLDYHEKRLSKAVAECTLIANRFHRSPVAPYALLLSGRIKTEMKDYAGAQRDLNQLVQIYHTAPIADQAYLELANAAKSAGMIEQANDAYRRVYNMAMRSSAQQTAALGAAQCFYKQDQPDEADRWVKRYLNSNPPSETPDYYRAYMLLGKVNLALEKTDQAVAAFRYALSGQLPKSEYLEPVHQFIEVLNKKGKFVEALQIIEDARRDELNTHERAELLILESSVYRGMHLPHRLQDTLDEQAEFTSDEQLRGKILYEIALCELASGNLQTAHRKLTELLRVVEPGPLADEVTMKLAQTCIRMGKYEQAISLSAGILEKQDLPAQLRVKLVDIKAQAQQNLQDYDQAALTLINSLYNDDQGT